MLLRKLNNSIDKTTSFATVQLYLNIGLSAVLAIALLISANTRERIVLVPPHLDEEMIVEWDKANETFHKSWAIYIATLVGNITPHNADFVIRSLSEIMSPKIYPSVRARLLSLSKVPAFSSGSTLAYFVPSRVVYEPTTGKVFAIGEYISTTASATGQFDETKLVTFEFIIEVTGGRPMVSHFATYPGATPKTLKWKRANRAQLEREEREAREDQQLQQAACQEQ